MGWLCHCHPKSSSKLGLDRKVGPGSAAPLCSCPTSGPVGLPKAQLALGEAARGRGTARAPAGGLSIPAASLSDCVIEGKIFSLSKPHSLKVQMAIIDPYHRVLDEDLNERRNIKRTKQ